MASGNADRLTAKAREIEYEERLTMAEQKKTQPREWKTPKLRMVVPARRTRGGVGDLNDQDDVWYNAS